MLALSLTMALSARQVRLYGYVLDTDNRGIELANVYVEGTQNGTATNKNGYFNLFVDDSDTIVLVFSMLGYQTIRQPLKPERDVLQLNVVLPTDAEMLEEVQVKGIRRQTSTMEQLDIENARLMPDASGGSIESLLITFAGVSQNNELSSQYNVRGGSFDENEVYVNGIEIHRPLLIRAGQQEGLSFVNPDMVQSLQFAAGGFDAKYGDKMSSVLDITYKQPDRFESTISLSVLGASAYIGYGDSAFSMMHGLRYKTSKYMLGALPTKGNYQPNFIDYQTYFTWNVGRQQPDKSWKMSFMGDYSQNNYNFIPSSLETTNGTMDNARTLTVAFDGQEQDIFRTAFAALGAQGKINKNTTINFDVSGFYTNESENFDITAEYFLKPADMSGGSNQVNIDSVNSSLLGTGLYHQHARNRLHAAVATVAHSGEWKHYANTMAWGASAQIEYITDHINEWERRDSMGYSLPSNDNAMEIFYSLRGNNTMFSGRLQGYLQDTYKWETTKGNILLTGGARLNWWTYTGEVLCSPRASVTYIPGWKRDFAFRLATGLYYQAPFYKELRDTVTNNDGITYIRLNDKLKAQRSVHVILGGDYYFRAWGRPFKLTAEAYYKFSDNIVSYTVDNVRVRYSGENDAIGYTTGLDLKLYGELVPGAESWISFSTMFSREKKYGTDQWLIGPNEQRWAFSMLFQDYIPRFPRFKVHLKTIFSDGLPYFNPRNNTSRWHMKPYMRIDLGASCTFSEKTDQWMKKAKHIKSWTLQFEVFNIADFHNVNSYYWVTDINNNQWATPNYLTGRMFNGRVIIDFK